MSYAQRLEAYLRQHRNEAQSVPMAAYMKHLFPFLGLPTPVRTVLTRGFIQENGLPGKDEFRSAIRDLWALPEREYQYTAQVLLERFRKQLTADDIRLAEELILSKSWWDTVDYLASHTVGGLFARYPALIPQYSAKWMESGNRWLQRTLLLFQLGYKEKTDAGLLFRLIRDCLGSKEFFINKAIGWALREYSKTDPEAVISFVNETELSPLSKREALKVLNRKGKTDKKDLASDAG